LIPEIRMVTRAGLASGPYATSGGARISAKHALLGLLIDRPGYPYELGDRLQRRFGPAWAVNPGQLYQTLDRLKRDDLIEAVDETLDVPGENTADRSRRQVLAITPKGIEEFERWFDEVTGQPRPSRRPLLVKVMLAGPQRLKRALDQIADYERDGAEALAELAHARDTIDLHRQPVRADQVLLYLSLTFDAAQLEGELRWAAQAHEVVSSLLESDVLWPSARGRADASRDLERHRRAARDDLFGRMSYRGLGFSADRETS
jgi:DNA-binding PadR family transcriptional regulator